MTPFWDDRVADWVAARIPNCTRGFGECIAMGVHDGAKIVGGVVLHNWSPEDRVIEFSAASETPRWITRPILSEAFGHAFNGLGCLTIVARHHEDNKEARKFWNGLGASEFIIPGLRNGAAEAISTLTREQWSNFIERKRHGKRLSTKAD